MQDLSNSPPTLYTTLKSGPGRKALAVARALGLSLAVETIDVYAGEGQRAAYREKNPFGKVPTLIDGDFILWESNAIALYLAEQHGDYRLSSRQPRARADMLRWMFWESAHFQPAFGPVLTEFVATTLTRGRDHADPERVQWQQAPLWPLLSFLEAHLQDSDRRVCGGAWSLADFALAGMMTYARAARFPFDTFPAIAAWYGELAALDAWQATECPLWQPS